MHSLPPFFLYCQAKANRGILYVDEVNLLDDGLVDVVLDSSASGLNTVEREGVSIVHPAKFIMIGSGNPSVNSCNIQHSHAVHTAVMELHFLQNACIMLARHAC